jgi:hypothetical protein
MKSKIIGGGIAAVAVASALGVTGALAGHTNQVLEARLDGREEVAANAADKRIVGDPGGRGSAYVFGIDGDPRTLCYVLQVDKIAPASAAHIHEGARGANGPVVVNLARPEDGDAADCLTEGEALPNGNPAFAPGTTVAEILANPAAYYVNVHNPEFPGGAVRGQLAPGR